MEAISCVRLLLIRGINRPQTSSQDWSLLALRMCKPTAQHLSHSFHLFNSRTSECLTNGEEALELLSMGDVDIGTNALILIAMALCYQLAAFLALRFLRWSS